jgi:hypothetical protein
MRTLSKNKLICYVKDKYVNRITEKKSLNTASLKSFCSLVCTYLLSKRLIPVIVCLNVKPRSHTGSLLTRLVLLLLPHPFSTGILNTALSKIKDILSLFVFFALHYCDYLILLCKWDIVLYL